MPSANLDRTLDAATQAVDPILMQVIKNGLDSVAEQMAVTLQYTAHSPVIREVLDFATALLDTRGRLISQSSAAPIFVNAMGPTLRFVIEHSIPLEEWAEGDVFLVNDPYLGGSQHLPDIVMFRPIFAHGELAGVCGCVAHHVDVGGTRVGQRRRHALHGFDRADAGVQLQLKPQVQLRINLGAVGFANVRQPHGAQQNGVGGLRRAVGFIGEVGATGLIAIGAGIEAFANQRKSTNPFLNRRQDGLTGLRHFDADPIAGQYGNPKFIVCGHGFPYSSCRSPCCAPCRLLAFSGMAARRGGKMQGMQKFRGIEFGKGCHLSSKVIRWAGNTGNQFAKRREH